MADREEERFHSRSVDAAAIRLSERSPDDAEVDHPPPLAVPEVDERVPNRHSASAEAAALRWQENHPDEE
jgi:hypothetical protein